MIEMRLLEILSAFAEEGTQAAAAENQSRFSFLSHALT